ncbi:MAG: hypothetical protein J6W16_06760 [Methanobrevibacter sp.]|nr:hypothetical protein [Methanobrevibacter sp.]MBP5785264.1 hypothetical protein [Methanobrevibacter sp.]
MKQEPRQTIDWIKKQINLTKENCIDSCHKNGYPEYEADYKKAMNFLDSWPDEELETLKIHQNGIVEIELRTITDTRLQYNDLYIQYMEKSNIVVIGYDTTPAQPLYQFNVITKGEPVKFKVRNDVGIFCSNPGLKVFVISNMELI